MRNLIESGFGIVSYITLNIDKKFIDKKDYNLSFFSGNNLGIKSAIFAFSSME